MNDTWRFVTVVILLVAIGALLPLVVEAAALYAVTCPVA
jgi:hypothetical protein